MFNICLCYLKCALRTCPVWKVLFIYTEGDIISHKKCFESVLLRIFEEVCVQDLRCIFNGLPSLTSYLLVPPVSPRRQTFPGRRGSMRRSRRCCLSRRALRTTRVRSSSTPRTSTSTTSPARTTSPSPRYMHNSYKHGCSFMQSQADDSDQAWPLVTDCQSSVDTSAGCLQVNSSEVISILKWCLLWSVNSLQIWKLKQEECWKTTFLCSINDHNY